MMRGYGYNGNMMGGWGWGGWLAMAFFGLLVLVGLVLLVVWAIRSASGGHPQAGGPQQPGMPMRSDGHDEAVAIAKRRLASGEITPEQYAEIMTRLGG